MKINHLWNLLLKKFLISNIMKLFCFLIILFLFNNCSFDNKTGIWKNENEDSKKNSGLLKEFKTISVFKDNFNEIITLDEKTKIQISSPINNLEWKDIFYNFNNNSNNFQYDNKNQINTISKKLSRSITNENILFSKNCLITNDEKGNIIIFSTQENKIIKKFNFYKNKLKNINKKINLLIEKNVIYASDNIGYLYTINLKTGELIWAKNYKVPFRSNIKIIDDKLITSSQNNDLYFFNKKNGDLIKFIPTEETVIKNQFMNNISITNEKNLLFLNTYGSLYSIDMKTMKIIWFINLNQSIDINPSNLFMSNEIVNSANKILITTNEKFFIIDNNTGSIIGRYSFSTSIRPIINQNYAFIITKNNLLIALDLNKNQIMYSSDIDSQISNFLDIKKKKTVIKSFMLINNEIFIFLKNSYILTFKPNGIIKSVKKLPAKINSFPILIDKLIYFLNNKNKLVVVS